MATRIDYDSVWQEQTKAFDHDSDSANYWDRRSRTFDSHWRTSTYSLDLLNCLELRPEYSVLDVACGTGVMTIPVAAIVRRVTALDISPLMLERLRQRAFDSGILNISIIHADWNQVVVGRDLGQHDVLLMSRSMPGIRLTETIHKINAAARYACYITWRAERTSDYEAAVAEAMGKDFRPYPDYLVIAGMLGSLGITAEVTIFESVNEDKYPSLEEAVRHMSKGAELTDLQFNRLLALARRRLTLSGGFYRATDKIKWAVISWRK